MKRLFTILSILLFTFASGTSYAQTKKYEYRPLYGYVRDTSTNVPIQGVIVFSFETVEMAVKAKETLVKSKDPIAFNRQCRILETLTDKDGRYLIPAVDEGALVFYNRTDDNVTLEEIRSRMSVSIGKMEVVKEERKKYDIPDYAVNDSLLNYKHKDRKFEVNFKYYLTTPGSRKDSRFSVERRVVDVETGEVLSSETPVVRDGKGYHRRMRKARAKDRLYGIAHESAVLSDTTARMWIRDSVDIRPWKDRCFRIGYFITLENSSQVMHLDTMYMMTNRVSRPLKYLQYVLEPYKCGYEAEDYGRALRKRVVVRGEYDGRVPQVLKEDTAYVLTGVNVKAKVAPEYTYAECMAAADTMISDVVDEIGVAFAGKLDDDVRMTMTSEIVRWSVVADALEDEGYAVAAARIREAVAGNGDMDAQTAEISGFEDYAAVIAPCLRSLRKVEYRYDFNVERLFSREEYLERFTAAPGEDGDVLEALCIRALEESEIQTGRPWDYAACLLAGQYIRRNHADTSLLAPFIDRSLGRCDIEPDGRVVIRPVARNRSEIVADQVIMYMLAGCFGKARELAGILPAEYGGLVEVARCKAGKIPVDDDVIDMIAGSSARNKVVMEMYTGAVSDLTLDTIDGMPEDDAMTWYLKARALSKIYDNSVSKLRSVRLDGHGESAYETVKACLRRCFDLDDSLVGAAALDADINEFALKEVLGVYVL